MEQNEWLGRPGDSGQVKCDDSYGKLLEIRSRLDEAVDPKFTPEQVEFFKSLITNLIDNIRSFKGEKKP